MTWINVLNAETLTTTYGETLIMSPDALAEIVRNFKPGTLPEMEIRGGGRELWARVEPDLPAEIAGQCASATVDMESISRVTNERIGAEMLSAGIFPRDFLLSETIQPIDLKRRP